MATMIFSHMLTRARPLIDGAFKWVLLILAASALASWPLFVNGQPFLLSDTMTYVRGADTAAYKATGVATDWTHRYFSRFEQRAWEDNVPTPKSSRPNPTGSPIILSGRSIYYGAFLYVADRLRDLRLAALAQTLLTVCCVYWTIARFTPRKHGRSVPFLVLVIILTFASGLAFFTCYLVPDIFTGLGILAAANLLCPDPPLPKREKVLWASVISASSLVHSSNIVILILVWLAALAIRLSWSLPSGRIFALVAFGIGIGVCGEITFGLVVERKFGAPPVRPPFLTARVVADGPGARYLRDTCPQNGFVLCRYVDRVMHYDSYKASDTFLWSPNPKNGVFSAINFDDRRRIAAEQYSFVTAVAQAYPTALLVSSAKGIGVQASQWHLSEFNLVPAQRAEFAEGLPPRVMLAQDGSLAFHHRMPVRLVEVLSMPTALVSLILLIGALWRAEGASGIRMFVGVLLIGIAANVIVCGTISTPHDRYLMRVEWLLPLGAFVWLIQQKSLRFARKDVRL